MNWISKIARIAVLAGLCGSAACYHMTYASGVQRSGEQHRGTTHFFLWGLAGRPEVRLQNVCPDGVAKLDTYQSFGDGFLRVITFGIYTPRTYEVWCAAPQEAP